MFVMRNMDLSRFAAGGFTAAPYTYFSKTSKFDLTLEAVDQGETIECSIEYCTDLFVEETIKRLRAFCQHAERYSDESSQRLSDIELLSEEEHYRLLHEFNNSYADYPRDKTIHQIFEEQAEKTPDNTALIFNEKTMTYAELNEKSNRLAHTLREKGVGPDKIIAIMTYRSFEMVIGILGIMKAGGAYMPIDPTTRRP
jgi:fengycin family lipopeptide synthetase D